ncbi:MAG: carcinine hydrolase/isopenicillin-N N-acyltransferase family protein [Bacteroides sp.]|nr:carcinine hydrolase/isopenicillin-N N-acyltransferase family protein [Bacteroides sp.]
MNKYRLLTVLILSLLIGNSSIGLACTSVIVSGKVTQDGRPLLLKNRDSYNFDNLAVVVKGEKYTFLAIVAAKDTRPENVWSGHNEKGFAIINTAAYNLNGKEKLESGNDGRMMRRALEICATLQDFEHLLDTLSRPMGANSNFGVIDAEGGCAYYETGNEGYKKFDANDPNIAPYGYLVRTNHAYSGDRSLDKGIERYIAIEDFMLYAGFTDQLNQEYLLRNVPRYLTHGFTKINLYQQMPQDEKDVTIVPFKDFIPRYQTTSTMLVQGVKKGESPKLTVSWTIVGSPLTTVAIPLCILPDGKLPSIITRGDDGQAKLTQMGLTLKDIIFPLKRGNRMEYIDLSKLINQQRTGILQQVLTIEDEVLAKGNIAVEEMRSKGKVDSRMSEYYQWVDDFVSERYRTLFSLE